MALLENLVQHQILSPDILDQSQKSLQQLSQEFSQKQTLLQHFLQWIRMDFLNEVELLEYLSKTYDFSLLTKLDSLPQLLHISPSIRAIYEKTHILCFEWKKEFIGILTLKSDWHSINTLNFQRNPPSKWYLASSHELSLILEDRNASSDLIADSAEASVIQKIHQLLDNALSQRCSDIHLEPRKQGLITRFRIDGYLKEEPPFPLEFQPLILSRIKLMSGMDIAIRRHPQDGHYTYHSRSGQAVDLRISSLPVQSGEKLVLRLLEQSSVQHKLESLGFFKEDLRVLREASHASSGLILVVGPTGSGKTTTLYALLNEMDQQQKNIITIENPVEYQISGINQVSIDSEHGIGFAEILRASLRQDPDVILVGEIRDEETAEIAVRSALTGHLVLSTLHSNDASTCIQRLLNLGISKDLLSDTLKLVVSQRLLRKLCQHHSPQDSQTRPHCSRCNNTGYSGRIPVYELLKINGLLQERICAGMTGSQLIAPDPDLHFHPMKQTANRLLQEEKIDPKELHSLLL